MYNKYFFYIKREIYIRIWLLIEINFEINFSHLLVSCDAWIL